jgi:hypothetical protein
MNAEDITKLVKSVGPHDCLTLTYLNGVTMDITRTEPDTFFGMIYGTPCSIGGLFFTNVKPIESQNVVRFITERGDSAFALIAPSIKTAKIRPKDVYV